MKYLILALSIATVQAEPWNPTRVSADAQWMLHADLDGLRATTAGKGLVERLEEKKGRQFRALKRMFSVNPLTDLGAVTLYGPGAKDHAVAQIQGRFDRAHIEDVIAGADDYKSHQHDEFTVHSWTDDKKQKPQFAAFAADDQIVFSERKELLHHALDILAGKAKSASEVPFLKKGPALIAGFAELGKIEMDDEESKLLRKAESLQLAVTETGGKLSTRLAISAGDETTAGRMLRVLDGIAAFAQLAEIVGSEVGFNGKTSNQGRTVEVTCSVPVDRLLALIDEHGVLDDKEEETAE